MLVNEKIVLYSNKIVLLPYSKHHVKKYHVWMKDPDIQAATASEPLCLAEEYKMQQSWRHDNDKLTFITCLPSPRSTMHEEIDSMIGDVNMFVLTNEEEDGNVSLVGEVEIMIARRDHQKRGLGRAALLVFLNYILNHEKQILKEYFSAPHALPRSDKFGYLRVKVKESNARSIALFETTGFKKTDAYPNFFDEFELRTDNLTLEQVEKWMDERGVTGYREDPYEILSLNQLVQNSSQESTSSLA